MTSQEAQNQITAMIGELKRESPFIVLRMAQIGLSILKDTQIEKGIVVDGSFAEYSNKPAYKSSFKKKALNSAGSAYASSGGKGTWGGFRAAQGRKSDHVNAFYTGEMWGALRVIGQTQNGYVYSVLTGVDNEAALRKFIQNIKRYGNFMKLSAEYEKLILDDASSEINEIVAKYLNA